jgi:hypothetical protein
MDTWETENKKIAERTKTDQKNVPPLTMAGVKEILKTLRANMEDLKKQDDDWNPYKCLRIWDATKQRHAYTNLSFYQAHRQLTPADRVTFLRPSIPWAPGYNLETGKADGVPTQHRIINAHMEAMDYALRTAMNDGVVTQEYVNAVLENFGVMPDNGTGYATMSDVAGCEVSEVYDLLQMSATDRTCEVDLCDCKHSPRFLEANMGQKEGNKVTDVEVPNTYNDRYLLVGNDV